VKGGVEFTNHFSFPGGKRPLQSWRKKGRGGPSLFFFSLLEGRRNAKGNGRKKGGGQGHTNSYFPPKSNCLDGAERKKGRKKKEKGETWAPNSLLSTLYIPGGGRGAQRLREKEKEKKRNKKEKKKRAHCSANSSAICYFRGGLCSLKYEK